MNVYVECLTRLVPDFISIVKHPFIQRRNRMQLTGKSVGADLSRFKDCNKGKRCFIIGNGPSLTVEDLDKLKGEDCFGSNGIWELYGKTDWRAKYYCLIDGDYSEQIGADIAIPMDASAESFFLLGNLQRYHPVVQERSNANFYYQPTVTIYTILSHKLLKSQYPRISEDIAKCVYPCGTVTYEAMQIALYMGYDEIYLLGLDHSYRNGSHFSGGGAYSTNVDGSEDLRSWTWGYELFRKTAERRGVKVMNATRGGMLEVFPRVNLDEVLQHK